MAELRSVDPRSLTPNPDNPRRAKSLPGMDEQLVASIKAIGIIQPPTVRDVDGQLVVVTGNRRVKAAIAADLEQIEVLVGTCDDTVTAMQSVSENLIRASMNAVDIWRATERLEAQGWNEDAIASALALPIRMVKRLKLLAHLHAPMLDYMAKGSMPNEDQLRTIAAAAVEEQAEVWKRHKPKKGHDVAWYEVARALSKRRIPATEAKFNDDQAAAYGVVWEDDLFAPAGADSRYTTNVDGFFAAQQEWLQATLPPGGTLLPVGQYGQAELPKKAEHVYGKPGKTDLVGHYLDPNSGAVKTIAYRMPEPKKPTTPGPDGATTPARDDVKPARPDVTQKGVAMIGDYRTDALHLALRDTPIDETKLVALLILALAGKNVSVQSGAGHYGSDREAIAGTLIEGGVLTGDQDAIHDAARKMLTSVLSCRANMTDSGVVARVAGDAIDASLHLPQMATEEFLSCLSKAGVEKAAAAEGVHVEVRGKDTRANLIDRFKSGTYVYPGALFKLTDQDVAAAKSATTNRHVYDGGEEVSGAGDEDGSVDESANLEASNDEGFTGRYADAAD